MIDKYGRETKVVKISGRYYEIFPESRRLTKHIKDKQGRFKGRRSGVGESDKTKYIRIVAPLDVNKDNIVDLTPGQIIGRIGPRNRYYRGPEPSSMYFRVKLSNPQAAKAMMKTQSRKFKKIRRKK